MEISGRGVMSFKCQTSEYKVLADVYYIPKLRSNIISLEHLHEHGYKTVLEEGILSIYDQERKLLAWANKS